MNESDKLGFREVKLGVVFFFFAPFLLFIIRQFQFVHAAHGVVAFILFCVGVLAVDVGQVAMPIINAVGIALDGRESSTPWR